MLCSLSACADKPLYSHYESPAGGSWQRGEEIFFTFRVSPGQPPVDIIGSVRLSHDFPYRSLPIGVVVERPDRTLSQKVLNIPIVGSESNMRSGFVVSQYDFQIDKNKSFSQVGNYTYSFRSLLADSVVSGVVELGLTVQ